MKLNTNKCNTHANSGMEYITIFLKTMKNKFCINVIKIKAYLITISLGYKSDELATDASLFYNPIFILTINHFRVHKCLTVESDNLLLDFESVCCTYPL
jgi:hypothetical protein